MSKTQEQQLFLSRDLSWLDFNSRVLEEAQVPANALLEQLKFIAIFSGNLDEFFMVRAAGLHQISKHGNHSPDAAGYTPEKQLELIREKVLSLTALQYSLLKERILPELARAGLRIMPYSGLSGEEQTLLTQYFRSSVLPVLTPQAAAEGKPFPILNSGAIEIAVEMLTPGERKCVRAFVEVPEVLEHFLPVPGRPGHFILLEDLIETHCGELFCGCRIKNHFPFRLIRDMDSTLEDDGREDLMLSIEKELQERQTREVIRLEYPAENENSDLLLWLKSKLRIAGDLCYAMPGMLALKRFFELINKAARPDLQEAPWVPVMPAAFCGNDDIFAAIAKAGTILVAPPYHSFDPVLQLLRSAADDPDVLAIKQTLYRVSGNSPVVHALRRAAGNGKQVTAVVELKARFDETNNILWARLLEEAGAHVIYGLSHLKVHAKALLIVRREAGKLRRYVHLSSGNYNDSTALTYSDAGIMSCDEALSADTAELFNVLSGYSAAPETWRKVAVSPYDLRSKIEFLIRRETAHARAGEKAHIIAKMNSLADDSTIRLLHDAAQAGVEIDLIVRGICCLNKLPPEKNLRVVSIVDRYLEHTRLFYFRNGSAEEFYLSSADWMTRNFDRRIELLFPVESPEIRELLRQILQFELADAGKGRHLQCGGTYSVCSALRKHTPDRSQYNIYRFIKQWERKRHHD